jgi:hypothetical protein
MRKLMVLMLPLFIAACAASGDQRSRADELAVYEKHAGAAEGTVRYTSIRDWWPVGYHSVVFEMDRSRHYLVRLVGACDLDLRSAPVLRVVGSRRTALSDFDRVYVGGQPCQIQSIRRVDIDAVRAELEAGEDDMPEGQGAVEVETADQSSGGT